MPDIEALIREFQRRQKAGENEAMVDMYAEDGVRVAAGKEIRGRDALTHFYASMRAGLRAHDRRIERVLVAGPAAGVLQFVEDVTHYGPAPSPYGEIAPSGQRFDVHGAALFDFKGDKIASIHTYSDGMFQMLARSMFVPRKG